MHVYKKGNEIFSINQNGIGHDGYTGTRIPNKAFKALKSKFSDWQWPDNQIIVSIDYTLILEDMRNYLRKARVFKHQFESQPRDSFDGYFHTFADDPFLTGGSGGYKN